ncbi:alpha/beta fold hydrolase [Sphingomonas glacialis]|uniref:Alpha/beta hydrolase n=1 Tax=Sphingomonas glacialis TaxID=658225 RepID=A0A502FWQ9_9SPHN|nr:alpha/beta hydrolase [Sphingomonas glacialis]TPG54067.1 alpha/beta hydrolase [Sphingomonas glacialis]
MRHILPVLLVATATVSSASAQDRTPSPAPTTKPLGANLESFTYPFPVHWYETMSQGAPVRMAYLDVAPTGVANGRTVVLLHGKNFCSATWQDTIINLAANGYRVIAPDQIGFCKSSKPTGYQYSFAALATLTRGLLDQAGAGKVLLVGHSTGGILATRFALLYPQRIERLVLVNPLGLNDTLAHGVPYTELGALRQEEAKTDAASIKAYQLRNYYHGEWRPAYDRWVAMLAGQYAGPDGDRVRDAQARLSDMIETQPVAAELDRVRAPVSLIIGQRDLTAFRANTAPAPLRAQVQTVPQAAESAVRRFPDARIVRIPGAGHAPQVEDPATFGRLLLAELDRR